MEARRTESVAVNSMREDEVSLLALGTTLVRSRWRILRWVLIGAVAAALFILPRPRTYVASASFISQTGDAGRSGLASIAGQMGIAIPSGNQSQSPDFYLSLLRSRVVLLPIAHDTLIVDELAGKRMTVLDLLGVPSGTPLRREEQGVTALQRLINVSVAKATGIVEFSVATKWRSVSLALVTALLNGVNEYNEATRQSQATSERKFIEGRLNLAAAELRDAENRLAGFQKGNRDFGGSPDLAIGRERLQRDLALRQQVFMSLTQAYEDARIREVRDTPVITVFEPPSAPSLPQRRGLLIGVLLGSVLGGLIGVLLSFTSGLLTRRQESGNSEAEEFANALREAKGQLVGGVRRLKVGK
jgi:uncharacterized protein involved in exopolysaccharide biosynthesis